VEVIKVDGVKPILFAKDLNKGMAYPIPIPHSLPLPFRRFCCFVGVSNPEGVWMGSGVLTDIGIISALHLFQHPKIIEVWATFILENGTLTSFNLNKVLVTEPDQDFIILLPPHLSGYFKPVKIGWYSHVPFDREHIVAFGCPEGLLGTIWKPQYIASDEHLLYTKGFACGGISGGGIFTSYKDEWYLWAINSVYFPQSKTLVSRMVRFKEKKTRRRKPAR
jgi:hypothetical protein